LAKARQKDLRQKRLLGEEDREEYDTFDKRCENDRKLEDIAGCTGVAACGFGGFRTENADADGGTDCGKGDVEVALDSGGYFSGLGE
jgi:hypothetical protein